MKIGIDARFFGPHAKGLGRYTQKLVANLEKIDLENQYVIFLRREDFKNYQPRNKNFKKALAPFRWYGLAEQIFFPFFIWRESLDLMHFPHFNVPIIFRGKFVVTIHDLILRYFPPRRQGFLNGIIYWFKNLAYELVIRHALRRAQKVIAVSQYVRKDILEHFKIQPEKIEVISEGAPLSAISHQLSAISYQSSAVSLNKYNISKPYLFYVGNAYPHKNLENLARALEILIRDYQSDLQLVLAGEEDYFWRQFKKELNASILAGTEAFKRIVFTGFLSEEELEEFYRRAGLYVFPSLCEGFGLPPLEAMSFGLPVASSNLTALPEILGQAAIYFNPKDPKDIAEKINQVLKDDNLRKSLIERGREQIKKYSWEKMALETKEIYQRY